MPKRAKKIETAEYGTMKKKSPFAGPELTVLEICAGAGGQALGLERAGFHTVAAVEVDQSACETLRLNRPSWNVICADLKEFDARPFAGVDLLAGGVPCPPFSLASKQLGGADERDLFPTALRLISETMPKAVLLENVRGLATSKFSDYRTNILRSLDALGYDASWELIFSSNFGVPQLRPRFILVALLKTFGKKFVFPSSLNEKITVGDALKDLMAADGWGGVDQWVQKAQGVAPTIVGGSKKHGGADLGPTRAKREWLSLGVDGKGIANEAPSQFDADDHLPRLTNRMVARIQGFPDEWKFAGRKTSIYRQIGNAFPPPVAESVGRQIARVLLNLPIQNDAEQREIEFL